MPEILLAGSRHSGRHLGFLDRTSLHRSGKDQPFLSTSALVSLLEMLALLLTCWWRLSGFQGTGRSRRTG